MMTDSELRKICDRFRGRVFGYIEALMLPAATERVLISRIKSESYDCQREIAEHLTPDQTDTGDTQ